MGYFSNSTDGDAYLEAYCVRCIHFPKGINEPYCGVWNAHMMANYKDCNNPESVLHILIPRRPDPKFGHMGNAECTMFWPAPSMGLPLEGGG